MEKSKFKCVVVKTDDGSYEDFYQEIMEDNQVILQVCNDNTMAMNVVLEGTLNADIDIIILDL